MGLAGRRCGEEAVFAEHGGEGDAAESARAGEEAAASHAMMCEVGIHPMVIRG